MGKRDQDVHHNFDTSRRTFFKCLLCFALLGRCSKSENRQKKSGRVNLKKKCAVKTFQRSNKECLTKNSIYLSFFTTSDNWLVLKTNNLLGFISKSKLNHFLFVAAIEKLKLRFFEVVKIGRQLSAPTRLIITNARTNERRYNF
jgi:hypothetical protein